MMRLLTEVAWILFLVSQINCICDVQYRSIVCAAARQYCANGASCRVGENNCAQCVCTEGWAGPHCRISTTFTKSIPDSLSPPNYGHPIPSPGFPPDMNFRFPNARSFNFNTGMHQNNGSLISHMGLPPSISPFPPLLNNNSIKVSCSSVARHPGIYICWDNVETCMRNEHSIAEVAECKPKFEFPSTGCCMAIGVSAVPCEYLNRSLFDSNFCFNNSFMCRLVKRGTVGEITTCQKNWAKPETGCCTSLLNDVMSSEPKLTSPGPPSYVSTKNLSVKENILNTSRGGADGLNQATNNETTVSVKVLKNCSDFIEKQLLWVTCSRNADMCQEIITGEVTKAFSILSCKPGWAFSAGGCCTPCPTNCFNGRCETQVHVRNKPKFICVCESLYIFVNGTGCRPTCEVDPKASVCPQIVKDKRVVVALVAASVIIVCLVAFFCIAIYIFWKKRRLWALKVVYWFQRYEDADDKPHDVFISYKGFTDEESWVEEELFQRLEREWGYNVIIHGRDFIPGRPIIDNIQVAVRESRRTIIVLPKE